MRLSAFIQLQNTQELRNGVRMEKGRKRAGQKSKREKKNYGNGRKQGAQQHQTTYRSLKKRHMKTFITLQKPTDKKPWQKVSIVVNSLVSRLDSINVHLKMSKMSRRVSV